MPSRKTRSIFLSATLAVLARLAAAQAGQDAVLDGQDVLEAEQVVEEALKPYCSSMPALAVKRNRV